MKKRNWKRLIAALGVAAMLGTELGSDFTMIRTMAEEPAIEEQAPAAEEQADEPVQEQEAPQEEPPAAEPEEQPEPSGDNESNDAGDTGDAAVQENLSSIQQDDSAPAEEQQEDDQQPSEKSSGESGENDVNGETSATAVSASFADFNPSIYTYTTGDAPSNPSLPDSIILTCTNTDGSSETISVTISGWISDPAYDSSMAGTYVFTPQLSGNDALVSLAGNPPQITITITESVNDEESTETVNKEKTEIIDNRTGLTGEVKNTDGSSLQSSDVIILKADSDSTSPVKTADKAPSIDDYELVSVRIGGQNVTYVRNHKVEDSESITWTTQYTSVDSKDSEKLAALLADDDNWRTIDQNDPKKAAFIYRSTAAAEEDTSEDKDSQKEETGKSGKESNDKPETIIRKTASKVEDPSYRFTAEYRDLDKDTELDSSRTIRIPGSVRLEESGTAGKYVLNQAALDPVPSGYELKSIRIGGTSVHSIVKKVDVSTETTEEIAEEEKPAGGESADGKTAGDSAGTAKKTVVETITYSVSYYYTDKNGSEHEITSDATVVFGYAHEAVPEITLTACAQDATGAAISGYESINPMFGQGTNYMEEKAPFIKGYAFDHAEINNDSIDHKTVTAIRKEYDGTNTIYTADDIVLEEDTQILFVYEEDASYTNRLTADANDGSATVTITMTDEAKVPEDTILTVTHLSQDRVRNTLAMTAASMGTDTDHLYGSLYDVTLTSADGMTIQPDESVHVTITYHTDTAKDIPAGASIKSADILHVHGGSAATIDGSISTSSDGAAGDISFETDRFSTIGVVYQVEFTYNGFEYDLKGNGSVSLSTILKEVGITVDIAEVNDVSFTDSSLLAIQKNTEGSNYTITALQPFSSGEELTVSTKSGDKYIISVTDEQETTNLQDLLTDASITINGKEVTGDTWNVKADDVYNIHLTFQENSTNQFANGSTMTYHLPTGVTPEEHSGTFPITIRKGGKSYVVEGNTYSVSSDGTVTINFNQDSPYYNLLTNSPNVTFYVDCSAKFSSVTNPIKFSDSVEKTISFDDSHNVGVQKEGTYNETDHKIHYKVTVSSEGKNDNVNVKDVISGSAITLDTGSVSVSGTNKSGAAISPAPAPTSSSTTSSKGFDYTFESMNDGDVYTITYTASVNFSALSGNGTTTVDEAGNKVTITSPGDSDNSDDTAETYQHTITASSLSKNAGAIGDIETNDGKSTRTLTWTIDANKECLASLAGSTISDTNNSSDIQTYSGTGISIKVYDSTGAEVSGSPRSVSWDDVNMNNSGWTYSVPTTDGNYHYVITYQTTVDVTSAIAANKGTVSVSNKASDKYGDTTGSGNIGTGVDTSDKFSVKKSVVRTTADTATWAVSFTVPKTGFNNVTVTDTYPSNYMTNGQVSDFFVEGSETVTGLLDGESYSLVNSPATTYEAGHFVMTFYKNADKTETGLKSSDSERTITITFSTQYNDALNSVLTYHENKVSVNADNEKHDDSARAYRKTESIEKNYSEKTTVADNEGNQLPVYIYNIRIKGADTLPATIADSFDTDLFEILPNGTYNYWLYDNLSVCYSDNEYGGTRLDNLKVTYTPTDDGVIFTIPDNSALYTDAGDTNTYYYFRYALVVKNKAALDELKQLAAADGGTATLGNTATFGNSSASADATYTYAPVTKTPASITSANLSKDNTIDFSISFNSDALELNGGNSIQLIDQYSSALSIDSKTISVLYNEAAASAPDYNISNNRLVLTVPDSTAVTVSYTAKVLGNGGSTVNVSNTVSALGNSAASSGSVTKNSEAGGTGDIYAINVLKYESGKLSKRIAGVQFELYDQDKTTKLGTYTTNAEGTVEIPTSGSLQLDHQYYLKEISAPSGYRVDSTLIPFKLDATTADYKGSIYNEGNVYYNGDTIRVSNDKEKASFIIQKSVVSETEADHSKTFYFTVTAKDAKGNNLSGTFDATINNTDTNTAESTTTVTFTDGSATVGLKDKQAIRIYVDEGDTYSVEETAASQTGFAVTPSGSQTGTASASTPPTASFTNTKNTGAIRITKNVTVNGKSVSGNSTLADGTYMFHVYDGTDEATRKEVTGSPVSITITNGKAGSTSIENLATGETYYVTEDTTGLEADQIALKTPEGNSASATVVANTTGTSSDVAAVSFTNNKTTTTTISLGGTKTLTGRAMAAGEFTFVLEAIGGTTNDEPAQTIAAADVPMPAGASGTIKAIQNRAAADGTADAFDFGSISYTAAGTYEYRISEQIPTTKDASITYDENIYWVKVFVVPDDNTGELSATVTKFKTKNVTDSGTAFLSTYEDDFTEQTASFANQYSSTGQLTVEKVLEGNDIAAYSNTDFSIKITLADENGSPLTGTSVFKDSKNNDVTFTAGVATVKVNGGDSVTITGIPSGYHYAVEEERDTSASPAYTLGEEGNTTGAFVVTTEDSSVNTTAGVIDRDEAKTVTVTNTRNTYQELDLTKTIDGNAAKNSDTFIFNITLTGTTENSFTYDIYNDGETEAKEDNKGKTLTLSGGKGTITLTGGQTARIRKLPNGASYTIEELARDGYELTVLTNSASSTTTNKSKGTTSGTITGGGDTINVAYTNVSNTYASLTVRKDVAGNAGETTKDFNFTVTLWKDRECTIPVTDVAGTHGEMTFASDTSNGNVSTATFPLRSGETKQALQIPNGVYAKVVEKEAGEDNYDTVYTNYSGSDSSNPKTGNVIKIQGGDEKQMHLNVTNTRDTYGDLKVMKSVSGISGDKTKAFTFTITLTNPDVAQGTNYSFQIYQTVTGGNDNPLTGTGNSGYASFDSNHKAIITVDLKDGQYVKIEDLPHGTAYEVTEADYLSDGYATTYDGRQKGTIEGSGKSANGTYDSVTSTTVTNTNSDTGSLMLQKVLVGNAANTTDKFTFNITLSDKDSQAVSGTYGGYTFTNGKAEIPITGAGSVVINGLPVGISYKVEETSATDSSGNAVEGYVASYAGDDADTSKPAEPVSGTVTKTGRKVTVTNTRNTTGDLEVSKTVTGEGADNNKAFSFSIELTNTGVADGAKYTYQVYSKSSEGTDTAEGNANEVSFADGKAVITVSLKDNQYVKISGLPNGTKYRATETSYVTEGYVTSPAEVSGTIVGGITATTTTAAFTNTYSVGSLTLQKTLAGNTQDPNEKFTFHVELFDSNGSAASATTVTGSDGKTHTIPDTGCSFTLKGGQSLTLNGIPSGYKFKVTEELSTAQTEHGYRSDNASYVLNGTAQTTKYAEGTIKKGTAGESGSTNVVNIINTLDTTGSLKVSKAVTGAGADKTKEFNFTVSLPDDATFTETINADVETTSNGTTVFSEKSVQFSNGVATFTLKDGQTIIIPGLPNGARYKVSETVENGYQTTSAGTTGLIDSGATGESIPTAAFTNEYTSKGSLVIQKKLKGNSAKNTDVFIFNITLTESDGRTPVSGTFTGTNGDITFNNEGKAEVRITGAGTYSITGLPAGVKYTVEEVLGTESQYELADLTASQTAVASEENLAPETIIAKDSKSASGTIDESGTDTLVYTNSKNLYGAFQLTKQAGGNDPDKKGWFAFTMTVTNADGTPFTGTAKAVIEGSSEPYTLEFENGQLKGRQDLGSGITDKAKNGEYDENGNLVEASKVPVNCFIMKKGTVKIYGLPNGASYTVSEDDYSSMYTTSYSGDRSGTITGTVSFEDKANSTKYKESDFKSATVTNTRDSYGKLRIVKAMLSTDGNTTETDAKFSVTVTLRDKSNNLVTNHSFPIGNETSSVTADFDSNGQWTTTIGAGDQVTIYHIPKGYTFMVSELTTGFAGQGFSTSPKYVLTYEKSAMNGEKPSGTETQTGVISEKMRTITITNTRNTYGDLIVRKVLEGASANRTAEFTVRVTLKNTSLVNTDLYSDGTTTKEYKYNVYDSANHLVSGKSGNVAFDPETKQAVAESITLQGGQYVKFEDLPNGTTYSVEETGDYESKGYVVSYENQTGKIEANGLKDALVTAIITNTRETFGKLQITKTLKGNDTDNSKIFNVTVHAYTEMVSEGSSTQTAIPDGRYGGIQFTNGYAVISIKAGEPVIISELPSYTKFEVTESDYSSDGYTATYYTGTDESTASTNPVSGTIGENETTSVGIINTRNTSGVLEINKDVAGNSTAKARTFQLRVTLYKDAACSEQDTSITGLKGSMYFSNGQAEANITDGTTIRADGLPNGEYFKVEELADSSSAYYVTSYKVTDAEGHVVNGNSGKITGNLAGSSTVTATVTNTAVTFKTDKYDSDGARLSGATFELRSSSNQILDSWTSDGTSEHDFGSMMQPGGVYTLEEVAAPKGYTKVGPFAITVSDSGTVTVSGAGISNENGVFKITDSITSIRVSKVDAATGVGLGGAAIQIINKSTGQVVEEWTSETDGNGNPASHEVKGLETGITYILRETAAPEGYALAADTEFTIDENGTVTGTVSKDTDGVLLVKDTKLSLEVTKKSSAEGNLAGAVLQLLDPSGNLVDEWTTGTDAHIISGTIKAGTYTLHEKSAPAGYFIAADQTIEITSEKAVWTAGMTDEQIPTVNVAGSKTWNDNSNSDAVRPSSITVRLYRNGTEIGKKSVTAADSWSWNWTGLYQYSQTHEEYKYTISEDAVSGYSVSYDGYNITNTHTPETVSVSGTKNWDDNSNAYGTRPSSITIRLYRNGTEIDHRDVTADDSWSWNFSNLIKYDENHKEYSYTITEDGVSGYTTSINGYNVTNTLIPVTGSVVLTKTNSRTGQALAGAVFALFRADGAVIGSYTTNAGGQIRVDGLAQGSYYFVETAAPEGFALDGRRIPFTITPATTASAPAQVAAQNTPEEEEVIDLLANKIWDDDNNSDGVRPSSITFRLFANGVEVSSAAATEATGWSVTFGNLAKKDASGNNISYTITEDAIGNYYETTYGGPVLNADGSISFTIRNYRETDQHYFERTGEVRGAGRRRTANGTLNAGRGRGTGDEGTMGAWGAVSAVAMTALIAWLVVDRRRKRQQN